MAADIESDAKHIRDQSLWRASCCLKALAAIFAAISADEIELSDESCHGMGLILNYIADDMDRAREHQED